MWYMCIEYASINIEWLYDMWMTCILFILSFSSRKNSGQKSKRSLTSVSKKSYWFFVIYSISQLVNLQQRRHVLSMCFLCDPLQKNICSANYYCCIFQFAGWALCEVVRLPGISSQYDWFFACREGTGTADPAFAASFFSQCHLLLWLWYTWTICLL